MPQKVIGIDRFLSSMVVGNIVALGEMEAGGVGASKATWASGKVFTLFSE